MSSIGWIDFSSEHRERLRTVLDLLSAPGVLDELGIGPVRDAFADRMFPGISTIQTRAKYFTLTALLVEKFIALKRSGGTSRTLESYLADEEKQCRIRLVTAAHGLEIKETGIIGGSFGTDPRRDVMRRPSSVYWNGLRLFGFIQPRELSLAEFSRRCVDDRRTLRTLLQESGTERGDDHDAEDINSRPRVYAPEIPPDQNYWQTLSIDLLPAEAEFLRMRMGASQSESLLGQILSSDANMAEVCALKRSTFDDFSALPFIGRLKNEYLRRTVQHARDFWLIMEGAHIRYNCLLQARLGTKESHAECNELWVNWRRRIAPFPSQWDTSFMWSLVASMRTSVKKPTHDFIEAWIAETCKGASDLKHCDALVTNQERYNKGARARLRNNNTETIGSAWIGVQELDYRQRQVCRLVRDIRDGLRATGGRRA